MIQVRNLTKKFGAKAAVNDLSFDVHPGRVTGFLGPNGSGKSTAMRCMVGLDRPNTGTVTFAGQPFSAVSHPLRRVGLLLDADYVHPARTGRNHLRWLAASNSIPAQRVDEVLEQVGMQQAATKRLKSYSLGMKQRLGLAATVLGDPEVIMLDEPANGLDPEGVRWIRDFLRHYAERGKTVFVSSHLLAEMSLMADDLIVIGQGSLISQSSVADFVSGNTVSTTRVKGPAINVLIGLVQTHMPSAKITILGDPASPDGLDISGVTPAEVGELAAANRVVLHELLAKIESLEDAFLRATADRQEYRTTGVES